MNREKNQDSGRKQRVAHFLAGILDGSMLNRKSTLGLLPFILFVSCLAMLLIFNTYYAEKKAREADQLRREMTTLRIRYIQNKSEYMYLTRQSEIARQLADRGFTESTTPPIVIRGEERRSLMGRLFSPSQ